MPVRSKHSVDVPALSIPSWLFGSPTAVLPHEPIFLDPERPEERFLSMQSYRQHAQRLAAGLRDAGLETGDTVLVVSSNDLALPIAFMGTIMAGAVFSGVNPVMPQHYVAYQAADSQAKMILASAAAMPKVQAVLTATAIPSSNVYLLDPEFLFGAVPPDSNSSNYQHWSRLLGAEGPSSFDWSQHCTDPEQLSSLNYTSGSTGAAKGAMTSHRNQVANSVQWFYAMEQDPAELEARKSARWVGWLPLVYIFAQSTYLLSGAKRGVRNYLMQHYHLETMLQYVEKYRPAEHFVIPSAILELVNSPLGQKYDLSSIQVFGTGGAPVKRPLAARMEKLLSPGVTVRQGWGMTEISGVAIGTYPLDNEASTSVGELLPNCEAKIMSPDGTLELGTGQRGELWLRAPHVVRGYWRKPEVTQQAFTADGWLRTGDLAYYDERGKFYVLDRLRELIITPDGTHILPSEVESVLLDMPGIVDAGVLSVDNPHDPSIQEARAMVVLEHPDVVSMQEIERHLERQLGASHRMTAGIYRVDSIPKLPGAKVDRVALRQRDVTKSLVVVPSR